MPTARELLEQADALMRRNRSPVLDDIPVLTDSVGAILPTRVVRGRAPSSSKSTEPQTIPTLTQTMAPQPVEAAKPAVVDEGEPSDWLQLGQGEPSAIGEAPDSIAIVPEVTVPETAVEDSPAEEIELTTSAEEAEDAFDEEIAARAAVAPSAEAPTPPSASSLASEYAATDAPPADPAFIDDPTVADMDALEDAFESEELAAETGVAPIEEPDAHVEPPPSRAAESIEDALLGGSIETATALAADAAAQDARWSSVAEEIRVQVLQRIDLFTDTGLHEQLGARLQPIVDRASADLVATINQHVGELLRAYVAEAIEREIENWRQNRP